MVLAAVRGYMMSCRKDGQVCFFLMQSFVSYPARRMRVVVEVHGVDQPLQLHMGQFGPNFGHLPGCFHAALARLIDATCWLCSGFMCLPAKSWHFACLETSGPAARGTSHGPPAMATGGPDPC